ncbi:class I SAM-dependent methyltransferase [Pusillimonas sp. SM2304]|uniref:class I SAM-dependent methyltransferase n=1 Tax=Pusillimonas sp. SM2304 TaxID=3073241 RepID=UPI002876400F|nr:class I SAM-dependent methyltransferase [Pusillimonas sp. SM2304]MDS1141554.1 class I SAM-dependent methyltransferase [Pusillimonas sp. SM2304]
MPSHTSHRSARLLLAASLALTLGAAHAQTGQAPAAEATSGATAYEPTVGQSGKDVVWVPTAQSLVDHMLRMADITPQDYLVDLGAGDGRTVITAAQQGTRAHGIEFNPDMVKLAREAAQKAGVADKATFTEGDIFESDFSDATVITLFLLPNLNLRLRPTLLDMKPGTRIVSNSFDMGDWTPDDAVDGGAECQSYCHAYKWVVPAKVEGAWTLGKNAALSLNQAYQMFSGHITLDGTQHEISDGSLLGTRVAFSANGRQYTGQVDADRMTGRDDQGKAWTATRKQ